MAVNRVEINGETVLDLTGDTVSAENLIEGATAHDAAGEKITGTVRVSNPNLLDNWYFADPVNQRGETTHAFGVRSYFFDRWIATNAVSVEPGYVLLNQVERIVQPLEKYVLDALEGKVVTLSILTNDGKLHSGSRTFTSTGSSGYLYFVAESDGAVLYYGFGEKIIGILQNGGDPIQLVGAKFELGDRQTLAYQDASGSWILNDPPPNKALELLKCQRYYQTFATESLRPTIAEDFRPVMRANPALSTIEIGGTTYYTADANL